MEKLLIINDKLIKDNNIGENALLDSKNGKIINKMKIDNYIKDYSKMNNNIENFDKTIKVRNSAIDLIRLIGMYGAIMNHILNYGNGFKKYYKYKKELKFLQSILFWHNNGFALISGIIGYKTNKYSNLLYLWLYVVFYSVGIHIYFQYFMRNSIIDISILFELFPIIFQRYWYFTAYFGMYLFLPVINKGISILEKNELKLIVISILGIFVFWRAIQNPKYDVFHLQGGFSILWLLTIYLTGAYIGKYRVDYTGKKKYIYCFFWLFIFSFSTFLFNLSYNNEVSNINGYFKRIFFKLKNRIINENYDSPIKVMQSISITLFFLQIKFNKYLSKIISFFGQLSFGIYLIHINKLVKLNLLRNIFMNDLNDLNLNSTIIIILVKDFKIFFICIFIDYLRNNMFI